MAVTITVPTPPAHGPTAVCAIPKEKRVKVNKGLSKYRRGFPVKLSGEHVLMLHMTYHWMQKYGETTPDLDELVAGMPPPTEGPPDGSAWQIRQHFNKVKTLRFRGPDVPALIRLLERAISLPFASCTFRGRLRDLKALNTMDLMVDAQRE